MKICNVPGCPTPTRASRCEQHQPKPWAGSNRRNELPPNWATLRAQQIAADNGQCVQCGSTERLEVDHYADPNDHTKLRTLCHDCHLKHTLKQAAQGRKNNK